MTKPGPNGDAGATPGAGGGRNRAWVWPAAIIAGLTLVVVVNMVFIYIAVSGADDVVPSYLQEER